MEAYISEENLRAIIERLVVMNKGIAKIQQDISEANKIINEARLETESLQRIKGEVEKIVERSQVMKIGSKKQVLPFH